MKVLVVDDEPLVRLALRRVCELHQHEVQEAEDGEQALKLWREFMPQLVFLDVLMPKLTGPAVLKEIGQKHGAKVVLMSAYSGEYDLNKAMALGAHVFVPKPFADIFAVLEQAEVLVDGRRQEKAKSR